MRNSTDNYQTISPRGAHSPNKLESGYVLKGEALHFKNNNSARLFQANKSERNQKYNLDTSLPAKDTSHASVSFAESPDMKYFESEVELEQDLDVQQDLEYDEEEDTENSEDEDIEEELAEHLAQVRKQHAKKLIELENKYYGQSVAASSLPSSPRRIVNNNNNLEEDVAEVYIHGHSDSIFPRSRPTSRWKPKVIHDLSAFDE